MPVFNIDWYDAAAYARWRVHACRRDGIEKAARGSDGRHFPWATASISMFAKMRDSRPGFAQIEPVGAFAADESPYGVRDLACNMRTWIALTSTGSSTPRAASAIPEPLKVGPPRRDRYADRPRRCLGLRRDSLLRRLAQSAVHHDPAHQHRGVAGQDLAGRQAPWRTSRAMRTASRPASARSTSIEVTIPTSFPSCITIRRRSSVATEADRVHERSVGRDREHVRRHHVATMPSRTAQFSYRGRSSPT